MPRCVLPDCVTVRQYKYIIQVRQISLTAAAFASGIVNLGESGLCCDKQGCDEENLENHDEGIYDWMVFCCQTGTWNKYLLFTGMR
jgi:hypothetical protein